MILVEVFLTGFTTKPSLRDISVISSYLEGKIDPTMKYQYLHNIILNFAEYQVNFFSICQTEKQYSHSLQTRWRRTEVLDLIEGRLDVVCPL